LNLKHFLLDTEKDKCLKLQNNYKVIFGQIQS